jgi:Acetyltransferase (GNAT) domain
MNEATENRISEKTPLVATVFHEDWWLNAVTQGTCEEVIVKNGIDIVGRLPFITNKQMGLKTLRLPPLTHLLGPVVDAGSGKSQTRMLRELSIVRELIDQLPRFDYFKQAIDSSTAAGLAFQERQFQVNHQYTFEIDCCQDLTSIWSGLHFKTRQHIRRAEEKLVVSTINDPDEFVHFYFRNLKERGHAASAELKTFPSAFAACRDRDSGNILCARWPNGEPAAMVFLVWGYGRMYYHLSTRAKNADDNGSISLLIWSALKEAHRRGFIFDFDGVVTSGIARFYCGFGGRIQSRTIVERSTLAYRTLRYVKRRLLGSRGKGTLGFL